MIQHTNNLGHTTVKETYNRVYVIFSSVCKYVSLVNHFVTPLVVTHHLVGGCRGKSEIHGPQMTGSRTTTRSGDNISLNSSFTLFPRGISQLPLYSSLTIGVTGESQWFFLGISHVRASAIMGGSCLLPRPTFQTFLDCGTLMPLPSLRPPFQAKISAHSPIDLSSPTPRSCQDELPMKGMPPKVSKTINTSQEFSRSFSPKQEL